MEEPLVSVVIPFYSGKHWLTEAIESVLRQTYENKEIIVINDGSKENIDDIIKKYKKVKVIYKENGGPASARNMGIEQSNGKYIAFLDSDDIWLPNKLAQQISEMESKKYVWSQHSYEMFWENNSKTKIIDTHVYSGDVYKDCFISFKVQTSCVVVLRSILIEHNIRFPIEKRYGQDLDFYKKIAQKYPLGYIKGIHSRFRIRGTNAGFRAKVQLNYRASTWKEIREEEKVLQILPKQVLLAYRICSLFSKFVNQIEKKYIKNENMLEIISKIAYLMPYTIFKAYSKKP